jgi:hypothetical protein
MQFLKMVVIIFIFLTFVFKTFPQDIEVYGDLKPGKYPVGFQLQEVTDFSRVYPAGPSPRLNSRVIRIYLWYPAQSKGKQPMKLKDYIDMAVADIITGDRIQRDPDDSSFWPVPLKKGIAKQLLATLLKENTISSKDVPGAKGPYPLIVLGQGLYYESPLFQRKKYGSSYLVKVPTTNHGCFTSYAALGLQNPVPGYWGAIEKNLKELHVRICGYARLFFDTYLKNDKESLMTLKKRSYSSDLSDSIMTVAYKQGMAAPPRVDGLIHSIISLGLKEVNGEIEELLKTHAPHSLLINILQNVLKKTTFSRLVSFKCYEQILLGCGRRPLFDEKVLNWLGYHFLFWWDRPQEALDVFKLNTRLFPDSANVFDSLGEAYLTLGDKDNAILNYRKSLQLNPQNKNAEARLKQLTESKDKAGEDLPQ